MAAIERVEDIIGPFVCAPERGVEFGGVVLERALGGSRSVGDDREIRHG